MGARPPRAPPTAGVPDGEHEPPPILGTWGRLYTLVIGALVVVIVLLAALTWSFR